MLGMLIKDDTHPYLSLAKGVAAHRSMLKLLKNMSENER